jgi:hypothetical protein
MAWNALVAARDSGWYQGRWWRSADDDVTDVESCGHDHRTYEAAMRCARREARARNRSVTT